MTLPGGRGTPTPGPPYRCTLHLDHHHQHHQHHHHDHNHQHHKHRHKHHHKDETTIYLLGGRAACPPSSIHGRLQDRFAPHDIPPLSSFCNCKQIFGTLFYHFGFHSQKLRACKVKVFQFNLYIKPSLIVFHNLRLLILNENPSSTNGLNPLLQIQHRHNTYVSRVPCVSV